MYYYWTIDTNVKTYPPLINTTTQLDFRPTHPMPASYLFEILNPFGVYSKVFTPKKELVSVYPNPSNEGFTIKAAAYKLVNNSGIVVREGKDCFIDTKDLSDGTYYLITEKGIQTILIQH